ncbi:hypothetical protein GWI33_002432 [Rhynchophorus ferrugineus]|uniref:Uncharacterized protein n=1 Tax=Rhynchophorus ferrugineus TaxID=354439 RepID=A0A834IZB7_RHYFE|nr:hypothetical protein GWI33_002432 [Rhynchophorus ferrugineus]
MCLANQPITDRVLHFKESETKCTSKRAINITISKLALFCLDIFLKAISDTQKHTIEAAVSVGNLDGRTSGRAANGTHPARQRPHEYVSGLNCKQLGMFL